MEGRVLRRSVTLADQLAAVGPAPSVAVAGPGGAAAAGSCNLRDLLKLRDEDDLASAGRRAAVTLASAMAAERQVSAPSPSLSLSPPSSSSPATAAAAAAAAAARTLLDIIRDDQPPASGPSSGDPFVRRAVSLPPPTTATASPPAPTLAAAEAAPAPPPPPPAAAAADEEEQEQRVSLMALLEQTDRQWSAVPGATTQPEEEEEEEEEEDSAALEALEPVDDDAELEPEAAGRGVVAGCCCVCMARAKGAAFIPCGHTFCRACARELLAGRGRCPLCNAAIVDVLDIF
ncbi:polycomb group RING finger protein 6 [Sorghum bicolor]|uniref:polycomb group RING finger protein 6 n=1 Tax=Sorghum bicolor TaxID=4558 RepID=UPI0001A87DAD|nr:polycomb group RING finger protein 6 [Sorghum bicolor]|eukprot:XP_002444712.1 polycomb group RING finger protein 6 [Sorghum bicolor]